MQKFGSAPGGAGEGEKNGNDGEGSEGPASSGDGGPSSMETVPGPLGSAMQTKRSGEVGGSPGGGNF